MPGSPPRRDSPTTTRSWLEVGAAKNAVCRPSPLRNEPSSPCSNSSTLELYTTWKGTLPTSTPPVISTRSTTVAPTEGAGGSAVMRTNAGVASAEGDGRGCGSGAGLGCGGGADSRRLSGDGAGGADGLTLGRGS